MLDLLIILLYVLVAVKILFSFFSWVQTRFNIFGKTDTPSETTPTQISQEKQTTQTESYVQAKPKKTVTQKSLMKEPEQNASSNSKKASPETFIRIEEPSVDSGNKESGVLASEKISSEAYGSFDLSKPESSKQALNESILPAELKLNSAQIQDLLVEQLTQKNQAEQRNGGKEGVSMKEFEGMRRQKENAIEKMVRYVQKANQQKQILISNHEKTIQAILNEKKSLQNKIQELKESHDQFVKQLDIKHSQKISELETSFNQKNQQMQTLLQQSQKAHQQELQYSRGIKQSQLDNQIESTINQTVNGSVNGQISSNILDPMIHAKIQQLKSELEFCQSQLQQAYQSEAKLKEQVEELKNQSIVKAKTKPQISITDVINHPEYLRIKEKLQKYQNGTVSSHIRSPMRSEITPRGDRLSKGGESSRISQRRSFIPSRIHTESGDNKPENSDEVFAECSFLNNQSKSFLLDEIKRIKKLPIKKTKLIFKLDKLSPSNPHEFIDNIPNIVLLIELTNKKVLGAFTQTAFSREEGSHNQSTSSIARSRLGTNKSLILDLTNKVAFINNNPNETIIYDENAIVWGKDELIIKNDEPSLLYSSFGVQEGVYSDGKYSVDELLGGNQGFERISQYEFYRIYIG